ncbi:MAG: cell envelope integrity protein TolA [Clostridiales bacterium]|nr:cell envelope integrity protein TolA [Clostridiales bacterium]
MATCPNCGRKIPFYDLRADCKACGVSIPNYNWMQRLEEDNKNAEAKFSAFYRTMNRIKYSLFGTKLRIARAVFTFLPIVAYIIPWGSVSSAADSFQLTMYSFTGAKSALDLLLSFFSDMSLFTINMGFEGYAGAVTYMSAAVIAYFLSLIFIVIAFFMNIFKCKKPKTKSAVTFDILTIAAAVVAIVMFSLAGSAGASAGAFSIGEYTAVDISGGFFAGCIAALVLFILAMAFNIAVIVAPAKSDDELETERLERAAAKEAKEKAKEIEKAKEREKAAKAQEEEQKKIIAEAKRKVAEQKAKQEAKAARKNK